MCTHKMSKLQQTKLFKTLSTKHKLNMHPVYNTEIYGTPPPPKTHTVSCLPQEKKNPWPQKCCTVPNFMGSRGKGIATETHFCCPRPQVLKKAQSQRVKLLQIAVLSPKPRKKANLLEPRALAVGGPNDWDSTAFLFFKIGLLSWTTKVLYCPKLFGFWKQKIGTVRHFGCPRHPACCAPHTTHAEEQKCPNLLGLTCAKALEIIPTTLTGHSPRHPPLYRPHS